MTIVKLIGRLKDFRRSIRSATFIVDIKKEPPRELVVEYLSVEMSAGPRDQVAQLPGVWAPVNMAGALLAYRYLRHEDEFLESPETYELEAFDFKQASRRRSDEFCDIYEVRDD